MIDAEQVLIGRDAHARLLAHGCGERRFETRCRKTGTSCFAYATSTRACSAAASVTVKQAPTRSRSEVRLLPEDFGKPDDDVSVRPDMLTSSIEQFDWQQRRR